jgi:hypothetical protein
MRTGRLRASSWQNAGATGSSATQQDDDLSSHRGLRARPVSAQRDVIQFGDASARINLQFQERRYRMHSPVATSIASRPTVTVRLLLTSLAVAAESVADALYGSTRKP